MTQEDERDFAEEEANREMVRREQEEELSSQDIWWEG